MAFRTHILLWPVCVSNCSKIGIDLPTVWYMQTPVDTDGETEGELEEVKKAAPVDKVKPQCL